MPVTYSSVSLFFVCLFIRKLFEGTVSHYITGNGQRMVAYRKYDGVLVHVCPEPEE